MNHATGLKNSIKDFAQAFGRSDGMNNVKQEHSRPRFNCDQLYDILVNNLPSQDFLID